MLIAIFNEYQYVVAPFIFVFIFVPFVDYVLGENKLNPEQKSLAWSHPIIWAPILYLYVITHFVVLAVALNKTQHLSLIELSVFATAVGLYTGGLGITVAHELIHKKGKGGRLTADILLATVCYTHFATEHIKGHHNFVCTPEDPASARAGESVYSFLPRTISGSFASAWSIDKRKVLIGIFQSAFIATLVYYFFALNGLIFFLLQSVIAILLLELVNYVEHYGLTRKKLGNGRYEAVRPMHSWNSSHRFSNLLLFNLQRHSDHHAAANLPYTVLKHHESAPQLPSGYPGMILLALMPPIWFRVMNKKLFKLNDILELSESRR